MKSPKQLALFREKTYSARHVRRALAPGHFHHVTFKARHPLLRLHHQEIRRLIRIAQDRHGIRLRSIAIMENHIHLLLSFKKRDDFANAMRFLAGQIAIAVGRGKLWLKRFWSRMVRWGRDLSGVIRYIEANPIKVGIFDETDVFEIQKGLLLTPL